MMRTKTGAVAVVAAALVSVGQWLLGRTRRISTTSTSRRRAPSKASAGTSSTWAAGRSPIAPTPRSAAASSSFSSRSRRWAARRARASTTSASRSPICRRRSRSSRRSASAVGRPVPAIRGRRDDSRGAGAVQAGFIFDPWGTRIELVEDPDLLGFHHVHLSASDPDGDADLVSERARRQAGQPERAARTGSSSAMSGCSCRATQQGTPRELPRDAAIDHLAFVVPSVDDAAADLQRRNVAVLEQPAVPTNARTRRKRALVAGPDNVRVEVVETGFAGVKIERATGGRDDRSRASRTRRRGRRGATPISGHLHGQLRARHSARAAEEPGRRKALTAEEAAARRERGTLGSIWGYEREWRDTTLEYQKRAPSTQVAMVIDPPDGRLPPMTAEGRNACEEAAHRARARGARGRSTCERRCRRAPRISAAYVRCITRGAARHDDPGVYNNGLQIVQGPGYVAVTKEMIHETRVIPTDAASRAAAPTSRRGWATRRAAGKATRWSSRRRTSTAKSSFQGASAKMKLTERFTRIGPNALEYRFTIDDPTIWTKPWTGDVRLRQGRRPVRAGRVRLPRGELRHDEHPQRRAGDGERTREDADGEDAGSKGSGREGPGETIDARTTSGADSGADRPIL